MTSTKYIGLDVLKEGSKSDRIDAHKLAELLYMSKLSSVYHGEHGLRMLKELSRSYLTITKDLTVLSGLVGAPAAGRRVVDSKVLPAGARLLRESWRAGNESTEGIQINLAPNRKSGYGTKANHLDSEWWIRGSTNWATSLSA